MSSPRTALYQQSVDEALATLGADANRGLSESEAQTRLAQYGRNELAAEEPVPAWRKFFAQFSDVLTILLLVATAISAALWLYERESALPYEAIAIFSVVLLNAILGNVARSARQAEMSRQGLHKLLKKHGIDAAEYRQ